MLEDGDALPEQGVRQGSQEDRRKIWMRKKVKTFDEGGVRKELRQYIDVFHGGKIVDFARHRKLPANFVSMVLSGDRRPSASILDALGLRRVVRYER